MLVIASCAFAGIHFYPWHDACKFTRYQNTSHNCNDGDNAGRKAGFILSKRAYNQGFEVFMMQAPHGTDFNNVLLSKKRAI
ncbi:toprim domain-containing protein [Bartonella taylorii]|uniref:toprim domain-containing protein n=1 Tax=Bartonella taylorii TaxID=33046 RepID=UPI0030840348